VFSGEGGDNMGTGARGPGDEGSCALECQDRFCRNSYSTFSTTCVHTYFFLALL